MRFLVMIVMLLASLLGSCASFSARGAEKSALQKRQEETILHIAKAEVARREPPYWAEGAYLEVTSYQDGVWIVTASGPYPLNTLGDFRWMEITDDGRVVGYRNGTSK